MKLSVVVKTIDQHFADWEGFVFGYGYGTGEDFIIPELKRLLYAIPAQGSYDHLLLGYVIDSTVLWLLINALCHADIIEYGSSPRHGWLTKKGRALKAYLDAKTLAELGAALNQPEDYVECYPDHCNCVVGLCHNPFWRDP